MITPIASDVISDTKALREDFKRYPLPHWQAVQAVAQGRIALEEALHLAGVDDHILYTPQWKAMGPVVYTIWMCRSEAMRMVLQRRLVYSDGHIEILTLDDPDFPKPESNLWTKLRYYRIRQWEFELRNYLSLHEWVTTSEEELFDRINPTISKHVALAVDFADLRVFYDIVSEMIKVQICKAKEIDRARTSTQTV